MSNWKKKTKIKRNKFQKNMGIFFFIVRNCFKNFNILISGVSCSPETNPTSTHTYFRVHVYT